jgi:hypothetical protein
MRSVRVVLLVVLAQVTPAPSYESATVDANGNLRIVASTGRTTIVSKEEWNDSLGKQTGFDDLRISDDRHAVGAVSYFKHDSLPEPAPVQLVIVTPRRILKIADGFVWEWHFVDGSRRVEVEDMALHGAKFSHHRLYDVQSGRVVTSFNERLCPECDSHLPEAKAPPWVRGGTSGVK